MASQAAVSAALRAVLHAESSDDADSSENTTPGTRESAAASLARALRMQGAKGDLSHYSKTAIAARRALRSDVEVRELLTKWFEAVAGPPGHKDPPNSKVVDRVAYNIMWSALVDHVSGRLKASRSAAASTAAGRSGLGLERMVAKSSSHSKAGLAGAFASGSVTGSELEEVAVKLKALQAHDWAQDSKNACFLTMDEFFDAVFETCDQWTRTLSRRAYIRWLSSNLRAVSGVANVAERRRLPEEAAALRKWNQEALASTRKSRARLRLRAAGAAVTAKARLAILMGKLRSATDTTSSAGTGAHTSGESRFAAAVALAAANARLKRSLDSNDGIARPALPSPKADQDTHTNDDMLGTSCAPWSQKPEEEEAAVTAADAEADAGGCTSNIDGMGAMWSAQIAVQSQAVSDKPDPERLIQRRQRRLQRQRQRLTLASATETRPTAHVAGDQGVHQAPTTPASRAERHSNPFLFPPQQIPQQTVNTSTPRAGSTAASQQHNDSEELAPHWHHGNTDASIPLTIPLAPATTAPHRAGSSFQASASAISSLSGAASLATEELDALVSSPGIPPWLAADPASSTGPATSKTTLPFPDKDQDKETIVHHLLHRHAKSFHGQTTEPAGVLHMSYRSKLERLQHLADGEQSLMQEAGHGFRKHQQHQPEQEINAAAQQSHRHIGARRLRAVQSEAAMQVPRRLRAAAAAASSSQAQSQVYTSHPPTRPTPAPTRPLPQEYLKKPTNSRKVYDTPPAHRRARLATLARASHTQQHSLRVRAPAEADSEDVGHVQSRAAMPGKSEPATPIVAQMHQATFCPALPDAPAGTAAGRSGNAKIGVSTISSCASSPVAVAAAHPLPVSYPLQHHTQTSQPARAHRDQKPVALAARLAPWPEELDHEPLDGNDVGSTTFTQSPVPALVAATSWKGRGIRRAQHQLSPDTAPGLFHSGLSSLPDGLAGYASPGHSSDEGHSIQPRRQQQPHLFGKQLLAQKHPGGLSAKSTSAAAMLSIVSPLGSPSTTISAATAVFSESSTSLKLCARPTAIGSPHSNKFRSASSQPVSSGSRQSQHPRRNGPVSPSTPMEGSGGTICAHVGATAFNMPLNGIAKTSMARPRAISDVGHRPQMPVESATSWSLGSAGWTSEKPHRVVRGRAGRTRSQQRGLELSGSLSARTKAAPQRRPRKVSMVGTMKRI